MASLVLRAEARNGHTHAVIGLHAYRRFDTHPEGSRASLGRTGGCPRIRAARTIPESSPVRQAGVAPAPPRRARGSGLLGSARSLHAAPPWWAVARPRATRPPTPVSCGFRRAKPHRPSPRCRSGYLRAPAEIPETPFFSCFTYACPEPVLANMIVFHEKTAQQNTFLAPSRVGTSRRSQPTVPARAAPRYWPAVQASGVVLSYSIVNCNRSGLTTANCIIIAQNFHFSPIVFRGTSANCPRSG